MTLAAMILLACLLVNLPWNYMLTTDTVIPEYAGWGLLGLLWLIVAGHRRRVFYRAPLLLLAFVLLSLPLLWMPADTDLWRALSRVVLLWCGGVFFLWWAAYPVSLTLTKQAACLLSLFGLVCAGSVLLYVLWPQGFAHWLPVPVDHRPSGGFRQVNLMASFLAIKRVFSHLRFNTDRNRPDGRDRAIRIFGARPTGGGRRFDPLAVWLGLVIPRGSEYAAVAQANHPIGWSFHTLQGIVYVTFPHS